MQLELTSQEIQTIIRALDAQPHGAVRALIDSIIAQHNKQIKQENPVTEAPDETVAP